VQEEGCGERKGLTSGGMWGEMPWRWHVIEKDN